MLDAKSTTQPSFLTLPLELQSLVITSLPYPDLLALRHVNHHFLSIIQPNVRDRINWLLDRGNLGLPLPEKPCLFKTDEGFCRNQDVKLFMRRRRRHDECRRFGKGRCLVLGLGRERCWRKRGEKVGSLRKRMGKVAMGVMACWRVYEGLVCLALTMVLVSLLLQRCVGWRIAVGDGKDWMNQ